MFLSSVNLSCCSDSLVVDTSVRVHVQLRSADKDEWKSSVGKGRWPKVGWKQAVSLPLNLDTFTLKVVLKFDEKNVTDTFQVQRGQVDLGTSRKGTFGGSLEWTDTSKPPSLASSGRRRVSKGSSRKGTTSTSTKPTLEVDPPQPSASPDGPPDEGVETTDSGPSTPTLYRRNPQTGGYSRAAPEDSALLNTPKAQRMLTEEAEIGELVLAPEKAARVLGLDVGPTSGGTPPLSPRLSSTTTSSFIKAKSTGSIRSLRRRAITEAKEATSTSPTGTGTAAPRTPLASVSSEHQPAARKVVRRLDSEPTGTSIVDALAQMSPAERKQLMTSPKLSKMLLTADERSTAEAASGSSKAAAILGVSADPLRATQSQTPPRGRRASGVSPRRDRSPRETASRILKRNRRAASSSPPRRRDVTTGSSSSEREAAPPMVTRQPSAGFFRRLSRNFGGPSSSTSTTTTDTTATQRSSTGSSRVMKQRSSSMASGSPASSGHHPTPALSSSDRGSELPLRRFKSRALAGFRQSCTPRLSSAVGRIMDVTDSCQEALSIARSYLERAERARSLHEDALTSLGASLETLYATRTTTGHEFARECADVWQDRSGQAAVQDAVDALEERLSVVASQFAEELEVMWSRIEARSNPESATEPEAGSLVSSNPKAAALLGADVPTSGPPPAARSASLASLPLLREGSSADLSAAPRNALAVSGHTSRHHFEAVTLSAGSEDEIGLCEDVETFAEIHLDEFSAVLVAIAEYVGAVASALAPSARLATSDSAARASKPRPMSEPVIAWVSKDGPAPTLEQLLADSSALWYFQLFCASSPVAAAALGALMEMADTAAEANERAHGRVSAVKSVWKRYYEDVILLLEGCVSADARQAARRRLKGKPQEVLEAAQEVAGGYGIVREVRAELSAVLAETLQSVEWLGSAECEGMRNRARAYFASVGGGKLYLRPKRRGGFMELRRTGEDEAAVVSFLPLSAQSDRVFASYSDGTLAIVAPDKMRVLRHITDRVVRVGGGPTVLGAVDGVDDVYAVWPDGAVRSYAPRSGAHMTSATLSLARDLACCCSVPAVSDATVGTLWVASGNMIHVVDVGGDEPTGSAAGSSLGSDDSSRVQAGTSLRHSGNRQRAGRRGKAATIVGDAIALPASDGKITAMAYAGGCVWVGTDKGALHRCSTNPPALEYASTNSPSPPRRYSSSNDAVRGLAVDAADKYVYVVGEHDRIEEYYALTGVHSRSASMAPRSSATCVSVVGSIIVVAGDGLGITLLTSSTLSRTGELRGHRAPVTCIGTVPRCTGGILWTGCADGTVRSWSLGV